MDDKSMAELQMMISGQFEKDGKKVVRVMFSRKKDYAEALLPEGVIDQSEGFSRAELVLLTQYLKENSLEIVEKAKTVNPMKSLFDMQ